MKQNTFERSFFQLLKPTIKCDKLQYICRDAFIHQVLAAFCSPTQDKYTEVLHITCAPVVCLIYVPSAQLQAYISGKTTCAHGITIKYACQSRY